MPINGFTVGRDLTLVINAPSGVLRVSLLTEFDAKPTVTDAKVIGLDGIVRHQIFHNGWQGTVSVERQDSTIDDYWAQLEDDYYNGLVQGACAISETISEPDGSVSQYRYEGVVLKLTDKGNFKGDATVKQKLDFLASRRKKV
jgi:hypothetical protein